MCFVTSYSNFALECPRSERRNSFCSFLAALSQFDAAILFFGVPACHFVSIKLFAMLFTSYPVCICLNYVELYLAWRWRFRCLQTAEEAAAAQAAAADPDNASVFTLDDRRIEVLPAVNKDELRRKSQLAKDRATEGKDKRNLYLAREGCKLRSAKCGLRCLKRAYKLSLLL